MTPRQALKYAGIAMGRADAEARRQNPNRDLITTHLAVADGWLGLYRELDKAAKQAALRRAVDKAVDKMQRRNDGQEPQDVHAPVGEHGEQPDQA